MCGGTVHVFVERLEGDPRQLLGRVLAAALEGRPAAVATLLDGQGTGEIDTETFSADLATVAVRGVNIHPAIAKGRMVNSLRAAAAFLARLPKGELSPESTEGRDGFLHPYTIAGGVAETKIKVLLRDFETAGLAAKADVLRAAARATLADLPGCHPERWPHIHEAMIERARQGKVVVRLKGGDSFVFGRGGEEAQELVAARLPEKETATP